MISILYSNLACMFIWLLHFSWKSGGVLLLSLLYLYLHLFDPISISLNFYYREVVNGIGETARDSEAWGASLIEEWTRESVGVVCSHLMRERNACFYSCQMTVRLCERISSFCSILVISSPASSARPVIVSDWTYLSLTTVATISVGGVERWQFD